MILETRLWASLGIAATLLSATPVLAGGEAPATLKPVTLTIRNDGADGLRCEAVLAHFMSETLGAIAPGGRLTVTLRRDRAKGTLALGPRQDRDVPLENILCGHDTAWTASKVDVPLGAVRSDPAVRFGARCAMSGGRAVCAVVNKE